MFELMEKEIASSGYHGNQSRRGIGGVLKGRNHRVEATPNVRSDKKRHIGYAGCITKMLIRQSGFLLIHDKYTNLWDLRS